MAFTRQMCEETGSGQDGADTRRSSSPRVSASPSARDAGGASPGISSSMPMARDPERAPAGRTRSHAYADSADVGWWPGKQTETVAGEY